MSGHQIMNTPTTNPCEVTQTSSIFGSKSHQAKEKENVNMFAIAKKQKMAKSIADKYRIGTRGRHFSGLSFLLS